MHFLQIPRWYSCSQTTLETTGLVHRVGGGQGRDMWVGSEPPALTASGLCRQGWPGLRCRRGPGGGGPRLQSSLFTSPPLQCVQDHRSGPQRFRQQFLYLQVQLQHPRKPPQVWRGGSICGPGNEGLLESGSPPPSASLGPSLQEAVVNVRSISETVLISHPSPDLKVPLEASCREYIEVRGTAKSLRGCQRQ